MSQTTHTPRRRRRAAALAVALAALCAPLFAGSPAGAVPAPLFTDDGLGIRVDENAIAGPALEAIETALQPTIDTMIRDGAIASAPVSGYHALYTQGNLELGFDFINAGTAGFPLGGMSVHADIQDIELQYRRDAWWHADCGIWVRPDDASVDVSAKVDPARLPNAPLTINPATAWWDDSPSLSTSGACWTYLIDDFWNAFVAFFSGDDPESTASRIEAQINGVAQDLVDDLWAEHVMPVVGSLTAYGISIGQLRTDDHGLIVTADVDATNGLAIPGQATPPINVSTAEDSGTTSNINDVLDERGEVIVTIHPNVVNQFIRAIQTTINGNLALSTFNLAQGQAVEAALLPPAVHGNYPDTGWSYKLISTSAPFLTAGSGAPLLGGQNMRLQFFNTAHTAGVLPVMELRGTWSNVALGVVDRPGGIGFGPAIDATNVTHTMAKFSGIAGSLVPTNSQITPFLQQALAKYNESVFVGFVTLAPIEVGGITVSPCAACTQYAGDQRFTKVFNVA